MPLSTTGADLLLDIVSRRYGRGSILVPTILPVDEWSDVFSSKRITYCARTIEMNGGSRRLNSSRRSAAPELLEELAST